MRRFLIFIVFPLNLLPMVTGNNEGTIKTQTLDNEYGYECEDIGNDGNPFTYVSVLPCDAVEMEYNFVDDEETFWDKIKAGGYFGYANNFLKQTYPNEYIGTKEEPTYKYLSSIDYKKEFVFARVNVDDDNTFSTDALSSNHIVQITGVNKEAGIVYYWSWGSNKYYSQNMKEPGVFEIIRIRR